MYPQVSRMPRNPDPGSTSAIQTGNISGMGIAIGHGATVHVHQQLLQPVPAPFRAGVQRMVEDYTAIFGGRDAELARLDTFLTTDTRPFALLIAPTGRGKTALLIHWIAHVRHQHPHWRVVFAPISIRYQTASEQVILTILAHTLAEAHTDLEQFRRYDQSPASLRAIIADYLRRPLPDAARLLVVIDGLDEATGWKVSSALLPPAPHAQVKLVLAARELAHTTRAAWYRELGCARRLTCDLTLEGLNRAAVCDMLQHMGNPLDALATDVDVLAEIERVSQGDPVTIRLLVELLQDEQIQPGQLANLPRDNLNAVFELWLAHLRDHEREHERVYALLSLVATAYGPLTTADLLTLDGRHLCEPRDVEDAARVVARFVIGDGTSERGYVFSHQKLREVYAEQRLGAAKQAELQQRFVQYGQAWYAQRTPPLPDYLRQFWVAHLQAAGAWELMREVLTAFVATDRADHRTQPWAAARYAAEGSYAGYLSDLARLEAWAEQQHDLALRVRCALIVASIRSLSANLAPELLVALVQVGTPDGRWSVAAALEHIRQMPASERQAAALSALLAAEIELPWDMALEIARAIADEKYRAEALSALAPHLPPDQQPAVWAEALAATATIANDDFGSRAKALTALAPHLPPDPALFYATLPILAARGQPALVSDLRALVPWLERLGPTEALAGIAQALVEVAHCWR